MSFRAPLLARTVRAGAQCRAGPRPASTRPYSSPAGPSSSSSSSASSSSAAAAARIRAAQEAQKRMYALRSQRNRSVMMYTIGALALASGITYAAVPAYRAFCAATGYAGTPMTDPARFVPDRLYATDDSKGRPITVRFEATSSDTLPWSFEPVQRTVTVVPGQTALAFYTATNHSDQDLIGIATYNMTPEKVSKEGVKREDVGRGERVGAQWGEEERVCCGRYTIPGCIDLAAVTLGAGTMAWPSCHS